MYNKEIKKAFLRESKKSTIEGRTFVFQNSANTEEFYDKDLYNFSIDQIEEVFQSYQATSIEYLETVRSHIKNYITWAIHKGYRQSNIHPMDGFTRKDLEKFVVKGVQNFFSEEQIEDMIVNHCPSYQDKALIRVIYEGVMGDDLSEIVNLKKDDVDEENNILTLHDDGTKVARKIVVSDRCIELIQKATQERTYIPPKENAIEHDLIPSEHVFRNHIAARTRYDYPTARMVRRRFTSLREALELYKFSPSEVSLSGQIRYAAEIYKRTGKLKRADKFMIARRFGKGKTLDENGEKIIRDHLVLNITLEAVKNTYDIDSMDHFTFPTE